MSEQIVNADRKLFTLINSCHDSVVDFVMYWASDKLIWIPFYIWLLYMLWRIYGKNIIWILIMVALMITVSDQVSVLIKNSVARLRPCHDPLLAGSIHLVNNGCGGKYGFLSSHASNSMSLSLFVSMILPPGYRWMRYELLGYMLIVGYSRIYLGAHFPGDVLGGWLLGVLTAIPAVYLFRYIVNKKNLNTV